MSDSGCTFGSSNVSALHRWARFSRLCYLWWRVAPQKGHKQIKNISRNMGMISIFKRKESWKKRNTNIWYVWFVNVYDNLSTNYIFWNAGIHVKPLSPGKKRGTQMKVTPLAPVNKQLGGVRDYRARFDCCAPFIKLTCCGTMWTHHFALALQRKRCHQTSSHFYPYLFQALPFEWTKTV